MHDLESRFRLDQQAQAGVERMMGAQSTASVFSPSVPAVRH